MEMSENRSDVIKFRCTLNQLDLVNNFYRKTSKKGVTVIESGSDKDVDKLSESDRNGEHFISEIFLRGWRAILAMLLMCE